MAGIVRYFRVRSLFYQKQGGIGTPVVKKTDQRSPSLVVRNVQISSILDKFTDYLLVSAPGSGMKGRF